MIMKNFFLFLIGIILCAWMTSCIETYYTTEKIDLENEARNRWKGATKQEIIQNFGPPNSERPDGDDGTLLVYNMNKSDGETINRNNYIWFYLNSRGICTNLKSDYFYRFEEEKHTRVNKEDSFYVFLYLGVPLLIVLIGLKATSQI